MHGILVGAGDAEGIGDSEIVGETEGIGDNEIVGETEGVGVAAGEGDILQLGDCEGDCVLDCDSGMSTDVAYNSPDEPMMTALPLPLMPMLIPK